MYFHFKPIRYQDFNLISIQVSWWQLWIKRAYLFGGSLHYNYNRNCRAKINYLLIAFWLANTERMLYKNTAGSHGVTVLRHRTIWTTADYFLECFCRFPSFVKPQVLLNLENKNENQFHERLECTSRFSLSFLSSCLFWFNLRQGQSPYLRSFSLFAQKTKGYREWMNNCPSF